MNFPTVEISAPPKHYPGFAYILLRSLTAGTQAPCPIWLEAYDRASGRLNLLRTMEAGYEITSATLEGLRGQGLRNGYIKNADLPRYQDYLAHSLQKLLRESSPQRDHVAAVVYEQALTTIKAAMLEPKNGRRIAQGASLVRDMVQQILLDDELRRRLLLMMSCDDQLYTHAVNSSLLGVSLARYLSWTRQEAENLALPLFFHDLGMAQVPNGLLSKKGPLEVAERQQMQDHPWSSYKLLKALPQFNEASLEVIRNHHENLDGSGYPRRLTGRQLSRIARAARIIDVYEAMTSERSWRQAIKPFEALTIMRREMTGALDMDLLNDFTASLGLNIRG